MLELRIEKLQIHGSHIHSHQKSTVRSYHCYTNQPFNFPLLLQEKMHVT